MNEFWTCIEIEWNGYYTDRINHEWHSNDKHETKDLERTKMCWTTTFINQTLESMNMSMVDRNTTKNSTRMNQDQEVAECKLTKQGDQASWMMMYQPN